MCEKRVFAARDRCVSGRTTIYRLSISAAHRYLGATSPSTVAARTNSDKVTVRSQEHGDVLYYIANNFVLRRTCVYRA